MFIVLTTILNVYWTQGIYSARCQSNNCFKHSVLPSTEVGGRGIFEREFIFLISDEMIYYIGLTSITLLSSLHYAKVVTYYARLDEFFYVKLNSKASILPTYHLFSFPVILFNLVQLRMIRC